MTTPTPKPGILEITPYVPGKSGKKRSARVIKLSSNENAYGPSPKALAAYHDAAENLHRYPNAGSTGICRAIGEVHGIDPARIVCGAGSDELIGLLVKAYAGQGDEVLYPEHGFLMYRIYTLGEGATPVTAAESTLTTDVDALLSAVTERTKLVFLANPNNPTGSYISASELERLRAGLPEHVVLVIDAAYAEYAEAEDYGNGLALALSTENTVMLRTFSKIYALPSLRLGWMVASATIVDIMHRIRGPFNVTGPAQAAGIAAVQDTVWVAEQVQHNTAQRAWLAKALEQLGLHVTPSLGNFLLVKFGSAEKAAAVISSLAEQGIFIRDVTNYGLPDCARITIGKPEENVALVEALRELL